MCHIGKIATPLMICVTDGLRQRWTCKSNATKKFRFLGRHFTASEASLSKYFLRMQQSLQQSFGRQCSNLSNFNQKASGQ